MECWDAYRKDGRPAGCDLYRSREIPDGLYHIVCEVLVKHVDGTYLIMQRDWNKEGFPGYLEAGASGSVLKGETPYEGALRELKEETGIVADDLMYLYTYSDMEHTFYYGYFCMTECLKDSITLQSGETIAYRWLDREAFRTLLEGDGLIPAQCDKWKPYLEMIIAADAKKP